MKKYLKKIFCLSQSSEVIITLFEPKIISIQGHQYWKTLHKKVVFHSQFSSVSKAAVYCGFAYIFCITPVSKTWFVVLLCYFFPGKSWLSLNYIVNYTISKIFFFEKRAIDITESTSRWKLIHSFLKRLGRYINYIKNYMTQ